MEFLRNWRVGVTTWRRGLLVALLAILLLSWGGAARAASWSEVVAAIDEQLHIAVQSYSEGQAARAREEVNAAYFGIYEEQGMEAAVRLNISARQAATEEYAFAELKRMITRGASLEELQTAREELLAMLRQDAAVLGQTSTAVLSDLLSAFLIIVREGLEAILILAALIAYLTRSGYQARTSIIYQSALVALVASFATAWLLRSVLRVSGAGQEVLEGITMLVAVVVLFFVSFWLLDKVQAQKWQAYIRGNVAEALSTGRGLALWWAAFLAVYREGAETALFYQALLSGGAAASQVLAGMGLGLVVLAVVFVLVRLGSLKIPLKPFFAITGLLLYYMAFVFAGDGVRELQEGGVIPVTPVAGMPLIEWLGLYPTWQTLGLQGALLLLALVAAGLSFRKSLSRRSKEGQTA